jgi:hypothetical protein
VTPTGHTVTGWPHARRPVHADRPLPPLRRFVAVALGAAVLTGAALAGANWLVSGTSSRSTPTSASLITVAPAADTTVTPR